MKRKLVICLFGLFLIQLALASVTLNNHTLQTEYASGDTIKGTINVSISSEPASTQITSNLAGNMTLQQFLSANNKYNFCTPSGCVTGYSSSNPQTSKTFNIGPGVSQTIGLVVTGTSAVINSLSLSLDTSFSHQQETPIIIDFPYNGHWEFSNFSGVYTNEVSSYSTSAPTTSQPFGPLKYCQNISLPKTRSILAKAEFSQSPTNITMGLYASPTYKRAECVYSVGTSGCTIALETEVFEKGDYYLCAENPVPFSSVSILREDTSSPKRGYTINNGALIAQNTNYLISARTEDYSDDSLIDLTEFFRNFNSSINQYIGTFYGGDCSSGCVLPITFQGVSQSITLSNLLLGRTINEGSYALETSFYDLTESPPTITYSGNLDLSKLNFVVGDENEFKLFIGAEGVIDEGINISGSMIGEIYPLKVPAGVPINFQMASATNESNILFKWSFGDGTNATTSSRTQQHTYQNISNYTLTIQATKNNLSETKLFTIDVVSPLNLTEYVLARKKNLISELKTRSSTLRFSVTLNNILKLEYYEDELNKLSTRLNGSPTDAQLIGIAADLFNLKIPVEISVQKTTDFLIFSDDDIDLTTLATIFGETINSSATLSYKQAIQRWFANNILVDTEVSKVMAKFEGNLVSQTILEEHQLQLNSLSAEDSYIIINKPFSSLSFSANSGAQASGTSTYIPLSGNQQKVVTITLTNSTDPVFFVSPKPSKLILDEVVDVNTECNFDGVCQVGENSKTCRDDCKPVGLFITYLVVIIVLFTLAIFGVSLWYQRHKEGILFGDRRQLFNLLIFIKNVTQKGMKDEEISGMLIEKGWVKEKIDYAISKSKSLGSPSLSTFNNFIDKRVYPRNAITQTQQQRPPKINKPNFQGMNKKR